MKPILTIHPCSAIVIVALFCGPVSSVAQEEEGAGLEIQAPATPEPAARKGGFRFPVGLTYNSGAAEVMDGLKDNYNVTSDFVWPVGISFNPYYELPMGLGFGAKIGPSTLLAIEQYTTYSYHTDFNFIVPVGAFARYTLFRGKKVCPYVRAGVAYNLVGGDYLGTGDVGFDGAIGVEIPLDSAVNLGVEVGYSTSTVTVNAGPNGGESSADYSKLTISVLGVF